MIWSLTSRIKIINRVNLQIFVQILLIDLISAFSFSFHKFGNKKLLLSEVLNNKLIFELALLRHKADLIKCYLRIKAIKYNNHSSLDCS